ncbi:MAG: MATE family efflux transporter [Bacteroidales bacterium]|jgi:putative MATE family efflux protein|nr:MATE family efflux transporter [Bacteroidales bacterium]
MLDLTEGKPWKSLLQFSIPMLIGNVLMQLYHIADFYIVGNYIGPEAVASVGSSMPILFALVSFIIGITMGCTVIVSQYFGAKDSVKVKRSIDTVIIFITVAALSVMVVGLIFCNPLLRLVKTPESVFNGARTFMQINLVGLLPLFGVNCLSAILRGVGDSKTPLYCMLISSALNVVLLLTFVPGMGWNIAGAAWATVLTQALTTVGMILWLNRKHPVIKITFHKLAFDMDIFRNSVRIGLPNGAQQAMVAVGMMALLGIVNRFSEANSNVLVAYSIVNRIDSLACVPAMTFSMAIAAFTGQNVGARKFGRIPSGLNATLAMSAILTVVISAAVMIFAHSVMELFSTEINPDIISIGTRYLLIVCPFCIVFSTMFIHTGVMRGAGDTLVPMFITLLSLWLVRIPVALFLSGFIGPDGIWWSIPVAWTVGALFAYLYYRSGRWKNKGVIKPVLEVDIPK